MVEKAKESIRIDLNQFKLHIKIEHRIELSLHFDSPSRRFYLSVMAFVVNEMQKLGRVTSIPLEEHYGLLALLNETVGGSAGSSEKENLLPRIYKKWKGALPDLEDAPLFRAVGRKKEYDNGIVRTYRFAEEEKDSWANLFEYKGSGEHVRLRFSIDKLGASLSDVVLVYGEAPELTNADAWERFIADLREKLKDEPKPEHTYPVFIQEPETPVSQLGKWKTALPSRWKLSALAALVLLVVVTGVWAIWNFYFRPPPVEPASVEKMAYPLPDKPSIAVLPFTNLSGDPDQEYFSDGMTEELITALSKVPYMFVIARNSTFSYKGKSVKIRQVAEELGVRYVLEGSFRKIGDKVRVAAQLIDAIKGHHLWAERYERELKDIFALQDEMTIKILGALEVRLTEGEQATTRRKGTDNLEAYLKALQAVEFGERCTKDDNLLARQMAEEAIALDPEYARPYRILAIINVTDIAYGASKSPKKSMERALEMAQKAISLDESHPCSYETLSLIYLLKRQHDRAICRSGAGYRPRSKWG
jgi:TolB-like protein